MPQAVAWVAAQAGMFAFQAASAAGLSITAAATIANIAYAAAYAGSVLAASAGAAYATRPDIPSPEAGKINLQQTTPVRTRGYGVCRRSGSIMLNEASKNILHQVYAMNDGRVAAVGQLWLHDDRVTRGAPDGITVQQLADGAYETNRVKVDFRLGADTETAYASPQTELPAGVWTSDHRGDGIFSMHVRQQNGKLEDFNKQFPNGPVNATVEAFHVAYDWRDGGQNRADPSTWEHTTNAVVIVVHELWAVRGFDWTARIAPRLAALTAAANACDASIPLKAGGTEVRYAAGGWYYVNNAPADVYAKMLEAMDGWMTFAGDGTLVLKVGQYESPTVTFDDSIITGYELQRFVEDESAVNQLLVSFTSPGHDYSPVETDPWRDEDDISARGVERDQTFFPSWVQSNGQARRLAKRRMSRLLAERRGTITTNLGGLKGLTERYIRLQSADLPSLDDLVVEVVNVEIDIAALTLTYTVVSADPNIDAWDPDTEEGDGPDGGDRVAGEALEAPTFDGVPTPFFEDNGTGGQGVRISATVLGPARDDLTWSIRWRVDGATAWVQSAAQDVDTGPDIVLETGFVPAETTIEVEVAYKTGGGILSPWSAAEEVDTSTSGVAPSPPTLLAVNSPSPGVVDVTWTNPGSFTFAKTEIHRSLTNVFGTATKVGEGTTGPGAPDAFTDTGLAANTYYYWATAEAPGGADSAPTSSVSVVVA